MELTNKQWEKIKILIPEPIKRTDGKGRPWRDKREVLEAILWILRTGAPWKDLPSRYPPYQTCHNRSITICDFNNGRKMAQSGR